MSVCVNFWFTIAPGFVYELKLKDLVAWKGPISRTSSLNEIFKRLLGAGVSLNRLQQLCSSRIWLNQKCRVCSECYFSATETKVFGDQGVPKQEYKDPTNETRVKVKLLPYELNNESFEQEGDQDLEVINESLAASRVSLKKNKDKPSNKTKIQENSAQPEKSLKPTDLTRTQNPDNNVLVPPLKLPSKEKTFDEEFYRGVEKENLDELESTGRKEPSRIVFGKEWNKEGSEKKRTLSGALPSTRAKLFELKSNGNEFSSLQGLHQEKYNEWSEGQIGLRGRSPAKGIGRFNSARDPVTSARGFGKQNRELSGVTKYTSQNERFPTVIEPSFMRTTEGKFNYMRTKTSLKRRH